MQGANTHTTTIENQIMFAMIIHLAHACYIEYIINRPANSMQFIVTCDW